MKHLLKIFLFTLLLSFTGVAWAQNAGAGIGALNTVNSTIASYFPAFQKLVYWIAALGALIGSIRVGYQFYKGDPNAINSALAIGGGLLFIVLVPAVIRQFLGI